MCSNGGVADAFHHFFRKAQSLAAAGRRGRGACQGSDRKEIAGSIPRYASGLSSIIISDRGQLDDGSTIFREDLAPTKRVSFSDLK